ncbi:MAG TPA: hypothetical protein VFK85_09120, partial [Anaeromyxobacteraceae bacterium]|nr:hypothetical protein [Anaeromyxobacteraceae bacterium]
MIRHYETRRRLECGDVMSHGVRAVRAALLASLLACAHTPAAPASVQSRPSKFVSIADVDRTILVELR